MITIMFNEKNNGINNSSRKKNPEIHGKGKSGEVT